MSRYDGLIIPRSYSEYINKTDAATLLQALQLSGVMDNMPAVNSNHPVTSDAVANSMSYYTTEQNTGAKWIDGKTIYRQVFINTDVFSTNSYQWGGLQSRIQAAVTGTAIYAHMVYYSNAWITREVRFATHQGFKIDADAILNFPAGTCYFTVLYTKSTD